MAATRKLMVLPVSNPPPLVEHMAHPALNGSGSKVPEGGEPQFVYDILTRIEQIVQAKLW